jgi:hypothetical protein
VRGAPWKYADHELSAKTQDESAQKADRNEENQPSRRVVKQSGGEKGLFPTGTIYDQTTDEGWVSVGIDHDTAQFATETLRRWWSHMGVRVYPRATGLLVTADGGGSNSSRSRLWKITLQGLADEIGLRITVCHFPPGTSKWNKIEHRMFCHITENWRSRPLVSRAVVVNLIGNTKTKTGLRINAELDTNTYKTGLKVTDEEFATIKITKSEFHGEWNYTISPRQ